MKGFQPADRRWNISWFNSTEEMRQWLGTMSPNEVDRLGFTDFEKIIGADFDRLKDFDEARSAIERLGNSIDLGGAFEKDRLEITDDASGIFDFGLASLGLQRLVEFYSAELANEHPRAFEQQDAIAGIVPNILVDKNEFDQYSVEYNGKT